MPLDSNEYLNLWNKSRFKNGETMQTPREMLVSLGTAEFNVEHYINSSLGNRFIKSIQYFIENQYEAANNVLDYWKNVGKGLKKEVHHLDCPEKKWASYVPLSASYKKNTHRKYPLLLVLHGGGNPIYLSETWGYIHVAAEHEIITIMPENLEIESLLTLLAEVSELYPVDTSRVYCTGFSRGAVMSNLLAMKNPLFFAGCAPCGNYACVNDPFVSDEDIRKLREHGLPTIIIAGRYEKSQQYPIYKKINLNDFHYSSSPFLPPEARLGYKKPTTMEEKVQMLKRRLYATRSKNVSFTEILSTQYSNDSVIRIMGAPFDQTETRLIDGIKHFIGDFTNEDGCDWFRMVCVDNMPHWPTPTLPELVWEFLSRFSRDAQTGAICEVDIRNKRTRP